ncbi:hypothetical protein B0H17DRAFT_1123811 [Mycena rosella]|uniref:Uncharacterized protein n=1 Tax=Mycena rosella TaxID=1033263 RepID=A0AAD7H2Z9_MYCRO|nr:hypothetical protein B0H17DRAFT_1123811 [Mycena rosella]
MPAKKNNSADPPRGRERPKAGFVIKGRQKLKQDLENGGIQLTGDTAREAQLANEDYGVPTERQDRTRKPVWLQHVDWQAKGWVQIASINTENFPQWFDDQKNDYQPQGKRAESKIVSLTHFGHPGDSPYDIRARKFVAYWSKEGSQELRTWAIEEQRPVWRWQYFCAGVHDRPLAEEKVVPDTVEEDGEGSESGSDDGEEPGDEVEEHRGRDKRCGSGVRLQAAFLANYGAQFELTADNLAQVKIWQWSEHDDVLPSQLPHLMISRILRLQIRDRFRRFGAKVTTIQRDLVQHFMRKQPSGMEEPLPPHRIPTTKQISSMMSSARQQERLDRNPFRTTWLMVKRNPHDMYNYNPHDFTQDDSKSKFMVAIIDNFSLDSTILNIAGPNGTVFVDSTHRLQNKNRAATTALCTANTKLHMMPEPEFMLPGAYLISTNIKAGTIKDFIVETVKKIVARAKEVAADKSKIQHRDPAMLDRIFARCQDIAANGFDLTNINMDKSRSQYNSVIEALRALGIDYVFIRLCQFHVIQVLIRFDADNGHQGIGFAIPDDTKFRIIMLFHALQRCREWKDWEETKQLLGATDREALAAQAAAEQEARARSQPQDPAAPVEAQSQPKIRNPPKPHTNQAKADGRSCLEVVQAYFNDNWFVHPWIPTFTDIGMPPRQSRDSTWNTNNWAETAFKKFNTIFLGNKQNKRIDRLAETILNHHLVFSAISEPRIERPGQKLWLYGMPPIAFGKKTCCGLPVMHTLLLTPLGCTCKEYEQTGKDCIDILAARMLLSNGPIADWEVAEYYTEKDFGADGRTRGTGRKKKKAGSESQDSQGKLPYDETWEEELDTVLAKLHVLSKPEQDHGAEPYFGEVQVGKGGRPPHARPLHPWRRKNHPHTYATPGKYSYSPRFVKKRGPPKRRHLYWNSLFPATHGLVDAQIAAYRQCARRHAMMGVFSANPSGPRGAAGKNRETYGDSSSDSEFYQAPDDNAEFLNTEDLALNTMDPARWSRERYELRQDELRLFFSCQNDSSIAIEQGMVFLCGTPDVHSSRKFAPWTG